MSESGYEVRQVRPHHGFARLVLERSTGRILGGAGHNQHRAYVFPLNTPRGLCVVQEYAFDHPFHNGVFVGQAEIFLNGKVSNYWAPGPDWRRPQNPVFQHIGELRYSEAPQTEPRDNGFRFTYKTVWRGEDREPVLDEVRTIDLYDGGDGTVCDTTSEKIASYGPIEFAANKHGSIGARVQPQLLPAMGGQILGGHGGEIRRGLADEVASGKVCDYVAYEAEQYELGRFGVCLSILTNSATDNRQGPWFIRDYGMAMFNATMTESIHVEQGQAWTAALRVVAYDGPLTDDRARGWIEHY